MNRLASILQLILLIGNYWIMFLWIRVLYVQILLEYLHQLHWRSWWRMSLFRRWNLLNFVHLICEWLYACSSSSSHCLSSFLCLWVLSFKIILFIFMFLIVFFFLGLFANMRLVISISWSCRHLLLTLSGLVHIGLTTFCNFMPFTFNNCQVFMENMNW